MAQAIYLLTNPTPKEGSFTAMVVSATGQLAARYMHPGQYFGYDVHWSGELHTFLVDKGKSEKVWGLDDWADPEKLHVKRLGASKYKSSRVILVSSVEVREA